MTKSIVLLSGGLDSLVSLACAVDVSSEVLALTFDYGQKSLDAELLASKNIANYYSIKHEIVQLSWLAEISTSSLNLDTKVPVLDINNLDDIDVTKDSSKSVWVPNRNGLFANIAACFAEAYGFDNIYIGANCEEAKTFKDNSVQFVDSINNSFAQSMNKDVSFIAPLIKLSKQDIVKKGIDMNVPFELLHSCYVNIDSHCGKCESCLRLKRGLLKNEKFELVKKIFKD